MADHQGKPDKTKRLSKSERIHRRRLKQAARKPGGSAAGPAQSRHPLQRPARPEQARALDAPAPAPLPVGLPVSPPSEQGGPANVTEVAE